MRVRTDIFAAADWPDDLRSSEVVFTYIDGVLWYESAAELRALRELAESLIETSERASKD